MSPLIKVLVAILVAAMAVLGGYELRSLVAERDSLKETKEVLQEQLRQAGKVTTTTATVLTSRVQSSASIKQNAKEVQVEIEKRIPVAGNCVLPADWRVLHDAAAEDVPVPDATGRADAAAVTAQEAARTVTSNYELSHDNSDRLEKLQQWIEGVSQK